MQECRIIAGGFFGIQGEGVLAFCRQSGIVTVQLPISAFDGFLHLVHRARHIYAVVDAGSVSDDQRRSFISFGFFQSFQQLVHVGAHSDLSNVNVAVAHSHHAEVFLLYALAVGGELRDRAGRSRLGSLTAGVGVNFGIQNEDVDVFAAGEDVIQSAVADIVCPAVAAEDPNGLFDQAVFCGNDPLCGCVVGSRASGDQFFRRDLAAFGVVHVIQPLFACGFGFGVVRPSAFDQRVDVGFDLVTPCGVSQVHAVAEFGVVLEQAVRPCRSVTFVVGGVGAGGRRAAVDRGATGRVRNDHSVAEQLSDQLDVRSFAAARASARIFEQGLGELAALYGVGVVNLVGFGEFRGIFSVDGVGGNSFGDGFHDQSLCLCRANVGAGAASGTIVGADLYAEFIALESGSVLCDEGFGGVF